MSAETWRAVRELGLGLKDQLATARGADRLAAAKPVVREARLELEALTGHEAEAAREFLSAVDAAFRELP
jgi:hypothetical protein